MNRQIVFITLGIIVNISLCLYYLPNDWGLYRLCFTMFDGIYIIYHDSFLNVVFDKEEHHRVETRKEGFILFICGLFSPFSFIINKVYLLARAWGNLK